METLIADWIQFLVRWVHVIAGISWIGNSFYFMWMDSSFEPLATPKVGVDGELYMVHGGHFYHVEKRKMRPEFIPKTLHWFKWEATFTWISGFVLLVLMYYMSESIYLLKPGSPLQNPLAAASVGLGLIVGTWLIYDLMWNSKWADCCPQILTGISLVSVGGLSWALCYLFSGRGAFVHLGGIFATLMVLNVWLRILPGQKAMFEKALAGEIPNYDSGVRAKWRSTHNSYMTLPVLFMMVSNHFSAVFGHWANWILLILLCVLGGLTRHMMLQWNKGKTGIKWLIPISMVLLALILLSAQADPRSKMTGHSDPVSFSQAKSVLDKHCATCHSSHPSDETFRAAPTGVIFEDPMVIQKFAPRIRERAFTTKTMPLINRTGMTDEDRGILNAWVEQGAKIQP